MAGEQGIDLGICFNGSFLYFALSDPANPTGLQHIGSAELPTDAAQSIRKQDEVFFQTADALIKSLKKRFEPKSVRILTAPSNECWTRIPSFVYKDREELHAYLQTLMPEVERSNIELSTYSTSKPDSLALCIRHAEVVKRYQKLTAISRTHSTVADFQLGQMWNSFTGINGSYMFIGSYEGILTISSYLLGKLRAFTYFSYKEPRNLPYFWQKAASHLKWIDGYHEQIYLYGQRTNMVVEQIGSYWDKNADIISLNDLSSIGVRANEETYGFDLSQAFPAILMAVNSRNMS